MGHISLNCPKKAALYNAEAFNVEKERNEPLDVTSMQFSREGIVEGTPVKGIVLDTSCTRTMVQRELVPPGKETSKRITIRCAHGDTVDYPLAEVRIEVERRMCKVEAVVSANLPVPVLLGRDVPELIEILQASKLPGPRSMELSLATTRAQAQRQENEEERTQKEAESDTRTNPVHQMADDDDAETEIQQSRMDEMEEDTEMPGACFDPDLFQEGRARPRKTRQEKRQVRQQHHTEKVKHPLDLAPLEMRRLQQEDHTVASVREAAQQTSESSFFEEDGLLYHRWRPRNGDLEGSVNQLVLPMHCRREVVSLAHEIPLAGHLGWKKTADRIMQRFYWPTLFQDVKEKCRACPECQKTAPGRRIRAPLVPLPVVEERFNE